MLLRIFPESGFDASATTPVLLGVLVSWFFTEAFGWVFAGLVVPGYLAALFLLDPRAATIDVFEAALTYGIARAIGEHLSKTELTSRFFGRERFFLVVVVSIVVRIAVEGVMLPRVAAHATWAFSIGLVVVPLAANACWKTGLARGVVQNGVPTIVVWALLRFVLVPHTNLSLGGFNLAMENIGASFLASPKAYILLLTGAAFAAFANLRWGWDYSGILIPALLALVVVNPMKFIATIAEVAVLLGLVKALLRWSPLGRANIEGARRPVLFFALDYALRFAFAAAVGRRLPGGDVVEAMGFGYLLPTLLAVKASQKGLASIVVLPAAGVAGTAFVIGTMLGFGARACDASPTLARAQVSRAPAAPPKRLRDAALWIAAQARPETPRVVSSALRAGDMAKLVDDAASGREAELPPWLAVDRLDGDAVLVRERFERADDRVGDVAVLARALTRDARVVARIDRPLHAPEAALLAGRAMEEGSFDAIVVAGCDEEGGIAAAGTSASDVADAIAGERGIVVALGRAAGTSATAALSPRSAGNARAGGLLASVRRFGEVSVASNAALARVDVPQSWAGALADAPPAAPPLSDATAVAQLLSDARAPLAPFSMAPEDLLVLRRLVLDTMLDASPRPDALPIARQAAQMLGWHLFGPVPNASGDEVVALLPGESGRPLAFVARARGVRGVVVEAPQGIHEGVRDLAVQLASDLRADALLVGMASDGTKDGGDAMRAAHASATWPEPERRGGVVLVRAAASGQNEGAAAIGAWGGDGAAPLLESVQAALSRSGLLVERAPLDSAAREQAGRSLLGETAFVSVSVDERTALEVSLRAARRASAAFGGETIVDARCDEAARTLARALAEDSPDASPDLFASARRAAVEQSVAARRSLEAAVKSGAVRMQLAHSGGRVWLVVAARIARRLALGAYPVASPPVPLRATVATTVEECASSIAAGGECRVGGPP